MEAKELRIGNLVTIDNPKYWPKLKDIILSVKSISEISGGISIGLEHIEKVENIYYTDYHQLINYIKPIPLTEKWLLKGGFKEIGTLHPTYKLNSFIVELSVLGEYYTFRKIMNKEESIRLRDITKVHQLQNLYFALTGEELTFKN